MFDTILENESSAFKARGRSREISSLRAGLPFVDVTLYCLTLFERDYEQVRVIP